MRIGDKLQDKFDFIIFIPILLLIGMGLVAIYSSTLNHPTASGNFNKQAVFLIVALGAFFVTYFLPPQTFRILALPSYIGTLVLLGLVIVVGREIKGASSWINIGPFGFQPSEFGKITLILFMAHFLGNSRRDINRLKDLSAALAIGFTPIMLILLQPDMGTAIVYIFISLVLIFWSGISLFSLFVVLSPGIVTFASIFGSYNFIAVLCLVIIALIFFKRNLFTSATIFVVNLAAGFFFDYGFQLLKPHQQKRIETFIDPSADPLGSGYNALQAKVAIGSGGLFGKGFLEGNQTQLSFIPEQWTDFIYCVVGEEFGFIGSLLVVILFVVVLLRLIKLTTYTKDNFNSLILIGIFAYLFVHFSINIGMNVGITPVIGVPLPFLSYGGSSLLVNMFLIGIVLNIYRNRKQYT
ncbi:MAG: rod shape-determining protein RodA [Melioribacteraceae bacterium]|nr:rod shape-determining protein RodA [Melioribacteraceae bacterium]